MVDIPNNVTTTSTIAVGGTVNNQLEVVGDHDWFRINLTAGQSISVLLDGLTLEDSYLRIYDSNGILLFENDDIRTGIDRDSQLAFTATYSGTYYIDVGAWDENYAGTYQLSVSAYTPPPLGTVQQLAEQLTEGYWGGEQQRFNVTQGGTITVNLSGLTPAGRDLALTALATWSDIIGVTFAQVTTGGQITFDDNEEGAFSDSTVSGGFITSSHVNVSTDWLNQYGTGQNTYSFQTYIHEIGHALGLGHQGNYNGEARYPYDAAFQNDSWAMSVMSYFSQSENTYFAGQGYQENLLTTPMMADILAMSMLYGLSTTTRTGGDSYGGSIAGGAFCIFDSGGIDSISGHGYDGNQLINLNPGTFSNIYGDVGNISIAFGVTIEDAIGGSGADTIIGNDANNSMEGRDGNDTLNGGNGNDTLNGQRGNDKLNGGVGSDTLTGLDGADILTGGSGNDIFFDGAAGFNGDTITDFAAGDKIFFSFASMSSFSFSLSGNTLTYTGGTLNLTGFTGQLVASAVSGGVQLTVASAQVLTLDFSYDFNGDGRDDILWRNDDGRVITWLGRADGSFGSNPNGNENVSTSWQVVGMGDFNGDGRDDVLWRNYDGRVIDWLGRADGSFGNNPNGNNTVSISWQVAGTGDFNGDGRDDVLWRNDDGRVVEWLGRADGSFGSNPNGNYTVSSSWQVAGTGDFNGDGRDDILWRNDDGRVISWLGRADGSFGGNPNGNYNVSSSWQVAGTGDFNGDGRDDILWRNDDGRVISWLGRADGSFAGNPNGNYQVDIDIELASIGDFNGDGRDDILWRNDDVTVTEWLGEADGRFQNNPIANYDVPTNWHVQSPDLWV